MKLTLRWWRNGDAFELLKDGVTIVERDEAGMLEGGSKS